jgi:hypothetical protein
MVKTNYCASCNARIGTLDVSCSACDPPKVIQLRGFGPPPTNDLPWNELVHDYLVSIGYRHTSYGVEVDDGDAENGPGNVLSAGYDEYSRANDPSIYVDAEGHVHIESYRQDPAFDRWVEIMEGL